MFIVVRDKQSGKITLYCSGKRQEEMGLQNSPGAGLFQPEDAMEQIRMKRQEKKNVKVFTDEDYLALDAEKHNVRARPLESATPKRKRGRPPKSSQSPDEKQQISGGLKKRQKLGQKNQI